MKNIPWNKLQIGLFLVVPLFFFFACNPSGDSGDGGGTPEEVPAAPDNLAAVVADTGIAVDLSWQDNSDNESGFILERKLSINDEDGFSQIFGLLDPNTVLITDDDSALEEGKAYDYRVKAINDVGDSLYSNWADVYIPAAGGASEQMMNGLVYAAWAAAADNTLWFTWDDPSDAGNAVGQMAVSTNAGQQSGTDISIDYDQANDTLYVGWVDAAGDLWYNWDSDLNTPGNTMAKIAMPQDDPGQATATAVSIDYDPSGGLVYVGWVASDDTLWFTWGDPAGTGNGVAGVAVATSEGAQSGTDISIDCDEVTGTVFTAWIDTEGKVWYNWDDDPNTPGNTMARIAMPTNTEQATATAVSIDYDTVSGLAFVAWVESDNSLWFSWGDTADTGNGVGKVAVATSEGAQSGTDISVDYDPGTGAIYFSWIDTDGKVWYTWDDDFNTAGNGVGKIPMPSTDNQGIGAAVGFCF